MECKPSSANRREYLTGLGQAIAFCCHSDKAYLALPSKDYYLMEKWLWTDFIGIICVEQNQVFVKWEPIPLKNILISKEQIKRGYAYYRDLKYYEIYHILRSINNALNKTRDREEIDNEIWGTITKIRNWMSSKKSNLLNIKLLLRDLKLFDIYSYQILPLGNELLSIEATNDTKLKEFFRKVFLIDGNYIDIVGLIQEINDCNEFFRDRRTFEERLKESMVAEKLAGKGTNIKSDLRDILRILKELEIIGPWKKVNSLGGKHPILWKNIIHLVKFR